MNDSTAFLPYPPIPAGLGFFLVALLLLLLYVAIEIIFFIDPEYATVPAYTIMFRLGLINSGQLAVHVLAGILVIGQCQLPYWPNKIIGAFFTAMWWTMLFEMTNLSINRFLTVVFFRVSTVVYGKKMLKVLGALLLLFFAAIAVFKLIPDNNYLFVTPSFTWGPGPDDRDISKNMQLVSKYLMIVMEAITVAAYAVILLYIWTRNGKKFSRREMSITLQLLVSSIYTIATFIYWTYLEYPVFGGTIIANYISVHVWIFLNGINTIVFLIFNKRLRQSIFRMIIKRKLPTGREPVSQSRARMVTTVTVQQSLG